MSLQADWIVVVDKKEFALSEEQYQLLKRASLSGKTMVWFDSFVISIPHISYMEKVKKYRKTGISEPLLPEGLPNLSERISEAKNKLLNRI